MPLHIGEVQTDIQVLDSPESAPPASGSQPNWQQLARLRALLDQLLGDGERTAAHGNDD